MKKLTKKQTACVESVLNAEADLLLSFGYTKDKRPGNFWLTPNKDGSLFQSYAIEEVKGILSNYDDMRKKGIV